MSETWWIRANSYGGTSSASHASSYLASDTTARKYSHKLTAFIATIDAQVLEALISRP